MLICHSLLDTPMLDNLLKCVRNSFLITTGSKWLSCSLFEVLFIVCFSFRLAIEVTQQFILSLKSKLRKR